MSRDLVNLRPSTDLGQLDARWKAVCDAISQSKPDEEIINALLVALHATFRFRQSHSLAQSTTPEPSIVKWLWGYPGSQLPHMDLFFLFETEKNELRGQWKPATAANQAPRWFASHPALLWMLRCVLYLPSWPSYLRASPHLLEIRVAWWPIIEARLRKERLDITSPHIITPSDSDKIVHQVFRELQPEGQKINVDTLWNQLADESSRYLAGVHSAAYTCDNLEIFGHCLRRVQGRDGKLAIWLFEPCLIMVTLSHLHVLTRLYANDPKLLESWKEEFIKPGVPRGDLIAATKAVESGLTCMAEKVKEWIQLTSQALGWYRTAWRDTWLGIPESKSNLKQSLDEALQPGKTLLLLSGYEGHAVYILIQYKDEHIEIQWHNRWDADARRILAMSADGATCFPVVARVLLGMRDEVLTWCHKAALNHTKKRGDGWGVLYDTVLLSHRITNKAVAKKGIRSHATQASCNCTVENLFTAEDAFLGPSLDSTAKWIAQVVEPYIDDRHRFMDETDTRGREIVDLEPLYHSGALGIDDTDRQDETFGGGGGGGSAGGGAPETEATPLLPTATHAIKLHQQRYYAEHFARVTEPVIELMAGPELANQLLDITATSTSMVENVNHHGREAIRPVSIDHLFIRETHVLLVGATGTGKSVSARKIMLAWRRTQYLSDRFDAIFWIDCRNETTFSAWKKGRSAHWPSEHPWAEAWVNQWEEPSNIDENIQKRTLWVLDGFEHVHELDPEGWIGKLCQSQASLLVTSQSSEERLERFASEWRRVDVRGAGEKTKDKILGRLAEENRKRVRAQLQLWQDQYTPFYLYQLCIASACNPSHQAPVSPGPYRTYQHALVESIKMQSKKLHPDLPDEAHALVFEGYFVWKGYLLSKAAWLSWKDNRPMEDCALDLYAQKFVGETVSEAQKSYMKPSLLTDVVDPLPILQRRKKDHHFYFTHDSWQDYLCAYYLAHVLVTMSPDERETRLWQLYRMPHRDSVLMFTAEMVVDKCESQEQLRNVLIELLAPILIPLVPTSMVYGSATPYLKYQVLVRILNAFLANDEMCDLCFTLILDLDHAVRMPYLKKRILFPLDYYDSIAYSHPDELERYLSKESERASRFTTVQHVVQSARKLAEARSNPLNQVSAAIQYIVELAIATGEPAYSGSSRTSGGCRTSEAKELSSLKQYFMLILNDMELKQHKKEKYRRAVSNTKGSTLTFGSPIKLLRSRVLLLRFPKVTELLNKFTTSELDKEEEREREEASLLKAAEDGDLPTLIMLLRWIKPHQALVFKACQSENSKPIAYLLELAGEGLFHYREAGRLPIHEAFAHGNQAVCEWFINNASEQLRKKTNHKLAYQEGKLPKFKPECIEVLDELEPIHLACVRGHKEVMELLFTSEPTVLRAVTLNGWNLAHIAAAHGHENIYQWLERAAPGLFAMKTKEGQTPAQVALSEGYPLRAQYLEVLYVGDPYDYDPDYEKMPPTLTSLQEDMVKSLVESPDQLRYQDETGNTVLHAACVQQQEGLALFLLDKVAGFDLRPIQFVNLKGETPLHLACQYGLVEVVKKLIVLSPSLLLISNANGYFPIHEVMRSDNPSLLSWFIAKYPGLLNQRSKPTSDDILAVTPAQLAAYLGNLPALEALHAQNPRLIHETTSDGRNLAHLAAQSQQVDVTNWIREKQRELLGARAKGGVTLYHLVSYGDDLNDYVPIVLSLGLGLISPKAWYLSHTLLGTSNSVNHCLRKHDFRAHNPRITPLNLIAPIAEGQEDKVDKYRDASGRTLLHWACLGNKSERAMWLIKPSDENITDVTDDDTTYSTVDDDDDQTYSTVDDDDDQTHFTVDDMATVTDDNGHLPIHLALDQKMASVVAAILERHPDQLRSLDPDKLILLAFGSPDRLGHPELCKIIIENQDFIPLEQRVIVDNLPLNAIQLAACSGSQTVLTALNEAETTLKSEQTTNNWNLAHLAAHYGQVASLEWLAKHDGVQLLQWTEDDQSVLDIACRAGHLDCVEFLIASKIDSLTIEAPHLFQTCRDGHTGLAIWIISGHPEFLAMTTSEGRLPHEVAHNAGNLELAEMLRSKYSDYSGRLIRRGASQEATDSLSSRSRSSSGLFTPRTGEPEEKGESSTPTSYPDPVGDEEEKSVKSSP